MHLHLPIYDLAEKEERSSLHLTTESITRETQGSPSLPQRACRGLALVARGACKGGLTCWSFLTNACSFAALSGQEASPRVKGFFSTCGRDGWGLGPTQRQRLQVLLSQVTLRQQLSDQQAQAPQDQCSAFCPDAASQKAGAAQPKAEASTLPSSSADVQFLYWKKCGTTGQTSDSRSDSLTRAWMSFSNPSRVVNFPPRAPIPNSNSSSGISIMQVSDCKRERTSFVSGRGWLQAFTESANVGTEGRERHLQNVPCHICGARQMKGYLGPQRLDASPGFHLRQ